MYDNSFCAKKLGDLIFDITISTVVVVTGNSVVGRRFEDYYDGNRKESEINAIHSCTCDMNSKTLCPHLPYMLIMLFTSQMMMSFGTDIYVKKRIGALSGLLTSYF